MEVDFEKGKVIIRDDLEFDFKEIVTRKQMGKIRELREKHNKFEAKGVDKLTPSQVDDLEDEWFKTVLPLGLKNFDEDTLDKLTEGEIRELTASVYIFLTKFGSTALAKQFVSASKEIQKKEQEQ